MKRTILRYGFIGGFIVAAELIATTVYTKSTGHEFEHGMVIGYASMILAFLSFCRAQTSPG